MDSAQLKSDASAALVAGHFAKAGALFASYCATAPTDRQSLLRMGDAWARAGERVRAIDAYLAAAQGFAADGFLARAIAASKLVLELEPGHQRMQRILADLYAQRGVGPGVARRPRAVAPPPPASPPLAAPETPAPARATEEEAAEMVVTEFLLDTVPERSLEEALAEAVSPDGVAALVSPAAPAAEPAPPMAAAPPMLFPVPEPADEAAAPAAAAVEPAGARFLELSLDETELTPAPAPPPVLKPAVPRFALAEPGPPPPAVAPAPAPAAPPLAQAAAPEEGDTAPEPAQPEARYIDLSFDDDEPLEAAPAETPPSADTPLEDEPLAGEGLANGNGAEALARTVPKAPLFSDLSSEAFVELVERCPLRRFSAGERILQQDAPGEAFYVICEGQVAVRREEETGVVELARLSEGDFFGEMALLSGAPRVASVDAMQDGTLVLEISTALLSELTLRHPGVATALKKFCRQRLVGNLMATSALFRPLNRADRRELASSFRARDVLAGDVVLREGGKGDGLYLVLAGLLEVSRGGFRLAKLGQGEVFGESSLLGRKPVVATVRALQRTSLLRLPEEDFARVAERYPAVRAHLEALRDARARENARVPLDPGEADALLV